MVASNPSEWMASMCSARNWSNKASFQRDMLPGSENADIWTTTRTPDSPLWSASSSPTPPHVHPESGLRPCSLVQEKDALTSCFEWPSEHKDEQKNSRHATTTTTITNAELISSSKPACSLWTWCRRPSVWRRFWEAPGWSTCSPSGSCPGSWCGGRERRRCWTPAGEESRVRKGGVWPWTRAPPASWTRRLQVVLHNVPVGLHHLKHHVVLDVLHKVQHALSEGERSRKPARQQLEACENVRGSSGVRTREVARTNSPLGRAWRVLLEVFVADPDVAQQPLYVFAVKHVAEQHLVARQRFPAGFRRVPSARLSTFELLL